MNRFALAIGVLCVVWTSARDTRSLDNGIKAELEKQGVPGLSLAVVKDGKVIYSQGYGFANVENQAKMRANSVHELASVSKQFTAACIVLLARDGKLKLSDRLDKFFPDCPDSWKKITVLNLLHHTSGLPDYLDVLGEIRLEADQKKIVESIQKNPVLFDAGTKFEYSNSGYSMLGFIVANVSGKPLGDFLKERIWMPLGMKQTYYNSTQEVIPLRADGYSRIGSRLIREEFTSESLSGTGDGEVMSTALDLAKWDAALWKDEFFSKAEKDLIFTPDPAHITKRKDEDVGYGFGWMIAIAGKAKVFFHAGGWAGTSTYIERHEEGRMTFIILTNADFTNLGAFIKLVQNEYLPKAKSNNND